MATQKYSVEVRDTDTCWHREDTEILHRLGGPAFISSDRKEWYKDGRLHREDGPAIEYANGSKHWYLNGKRVTRAEHKALTAPVEEMTMAQLEAALGKRIKIIK